MEKSMEVTLKTKYRATIWSISSTPGLILREKDGQKGYTNPNIPCSTVHNNQDVEVT